MEPLLFIQTGGTIDKDYPKVTQGWGFEIADPAINRILDKLTLPFDYSSVSLLKKDSQKITDEDRENILKYCQTSPFSKIIITHGTDTLLETGQFLSILKNKLIILTGAMRPERFTNSDADFNIGLAVGAANCLSTGVYIAMHGQVIPIEKATRNLKNGQFLGSR